MENSDIRSAIAKVAASLKRKQKESALHAHILLIFKKSR